MTSPYAVSVRIVQIAAIPFPNGAVMLLFVFLLALYPPPFPPRKLFYDEPSPLHVLWLTCEE